MPDEKQTILSKDPKKLDKIRMLADGLSLTNMCWDKFGREVREFTENGPKLKNFWGLDITFEYFYDFSERTHQHTADRESGGRVVLESKGEVVLDFVYEIDCKWGSCGHEPYTKFRVGTYKSGEWEKTMDEIFMIGFDGAKNTYIHQIAAKTLEALASD